MMGVLEALTEAYIRYDKTDLKDLGFKMSTMHTDRGFPPSMFLAQLEKQIELPILAKVFICSEYQTHYLEHRRKAGIQEKNVDKIRKKNVQDIEKLIKTGEFGDY